MEQILVSPQSAIPSHLKDAMAALSWQSTSSSSRSKGSAAAMPKSLSRLKDCLDLLEKMDGEGTLDMSKIRHAKFFSACKKYKAVEEAFRFTKLIPKPSLSTYTQLLSVCAQAKDIEGAFEVITMLEKEGLKADCFLYTTLISACAKSGKVDLIFQVFHEMLKKGVEPNIHTYGALIDGCARAGQVGKAFGAYGIMRSKKLKPDKVIFNTLITACGRSGAVERAFDVLSEMNSEPVPVEPDHVTIGALIKACTQAGQVDRAMEVYKMMQDKGIKGSVEAYTEAIHACSINGDVDTAFRIFEDMKGCNVRPDEVFFSALIDVAGHAKQLDTCFKILKEMKQMRVNPGVVAYSAVMGACSNTGSWEKGLEVYQDMLAVGLSPNISTMNALLTALCGAGKLNEAKNILQELRNAGLAPNQITYTVLLRCCEQGGDVHLCLDLYKRANLEGIVLSAEMCEYIIGLCLQHIWKLSRGPTPTTSMGAWIDMPTCKKCALLALSAYRKAVTSGIAPTMKMFSQLLGCLRLPRIADDITYLSSTVSYYNSSRQASSVEGFGLYDPRAFSLFEEAASFGIVPTFSYTCGLIVIDTTEMPVFVAEVCVLKVLKVLKYRHAAGANLPAVTIKLRVKDTEIISTRFGQKEVNISSRTSQAVAGLLRSLRLSFHGHESSGKLKIPVTSLRTWLKPGSTRLPSLQLESGPQHVLLRKQIVEQQRTLRYLDSSMWSSYAAAPTTNKHAQQLQESNGASERVQKLQSSNGTCKHVQELQSSNGTYKHVQNLPDSNGSHKYIPENLQESNGQHTLGQHLSDSNGVHILAAVNSELIVRVPAKKDEILNTASIGSN